MSVLFTATMFITVNANFYFLYHLGWFRNKN